MIQDGLARALGWVGDERAIPVLADLAARDADLIFPTEALVRLGACRTGAVGGTDFGPGVPGLRGVSRCRRGARHDLTYRWHTWCETRASRVTVPLAPVDPSDDGVLAILSARALGGAPVGVTLELDGEALALTVGPEWAEHRLALASAPGPTAILRADGPLALDHLLLIPAASSAGAEQNPSAHELGEDGPDPLD
jgi:hypothetical protein